MKKTSVLKILCILLVVTLTCGLLFSTFGSDDLSETQMQSITFIKTGQVTTLINAGDTYFVKQENFGYDGSYVTPATERQITYQEYTELKANKNYDIYAETQQARVDGLYIDKSLFYHVDGQVITGSYYGRIIDG